jgi:hypothetical protein
MPDKPMIPAPAEGKRLTPAQYCWASNDTMLASRAEARDEGGWRIYREKGADVAAMTMLGEDLVLDFAPPRAMDEFAEVKRFYGSSPERKGWLRFRRPATHDPRPDLEAHLGSMLGTAYRERNMPPAFHSLTSAGGPYICLPLSKVATWGGFIDKGGRAEFPDEYATYQRVMKCPDHGAIFALADGTPSIVLGTPDALYWKATSDGGVLARACSYDADDDAALEVMLDRLPTSGWKELGSIDVSEPYRAIDAASFGGNIGDGNSLTMKLTPGSYVVSSAEWQPDDGTELLLVRLAKTAKTASKKKKTASKKKKTASKKKKTASKKKTL